YPIDYVQCVLAKTHHHNAANRLALAVPFRHASSDVGTESHTAQITQENGRAVLCSHRDFAQIVERTQIAQSPDHVLGSVHFQHVAANLVRALLNPINHS